MNGFLLKEDKLLKEKYFHLTLKNGFKVIVIPKANPAMFAMLCCDFGGADIEYEKDGKVFTLPSGTAHFLEHKMFENSDGSDAFLEFDKFGGNANAFTSFENTCYYFSCTDNFFENLDVLLKSVSSVHFSDESVEKEKKIIAREIKMYEDSPSSNVTRNLSKALYHCHPIIHPISGTVETISEITKETLLRAYNDFYVPSNMSLCICGDVDIKRVKEETEKYFGVSESKRPKTVFRPEPKAVATEKIEKTAIVASSIYSIGIKHEVLEPNDIVSQRKATAMRLAISLTFGRASDFYCRNYENGLINERFYAGFNNSRNSAYVIISGSGNEPEKIRDLAIHELEKRKDIFFTEEQIIREKRAAYAESLTLFDLGEDIVSAMAANARLDFDEFDCIEILRDIKPEEIKAALLSIDLKNISISIVRKGNEE